MVASAEVKLLALSNGHGEDEVACRILQALRQRCPHWQLQALPLVGQGQAYQQAGFDLYGIVQKAMPSGGFIYMDQRQLWGDLRSGLLSLTWMQLQQVRRWAVMGGYILAVGDIVPLLFGWYSGAPYAFVGTAKSEYYLRTEETPSPPPHWPWYQWLDCVYLPWERALLQHRRCRAVFPRDSLTAHFLQKWPIPTYDLGNPMMDNLEPCGQLNRDTLPPTATIVLLLPGSRPPEAYTNWTSILAGIAPLTALAQPFVFIAAITAQLAPEQLHLLATPYGWQPDGLTHPGLWLKCHHARLIILPHAFNDGLHLADLVIATAGTATEQCVGLGKPVITLAGKGPQFTWAFAEAQARLLGPSIYLLTEASAIPTQVLELMHSSQQQFFYQRNGQQRMGSAGAAVRIARQLEMLFSA
jgi:uncharacterized protein (TIGR03492 family)